MSSPRPDPTAQRKAAFKAPLRAPDPQNARRAAALIEQQRSRQQRQNATRTDIEQFQALSLSTETDDEDGAEIDRTEGVAKYVSSLQPSGPAGALHEHGHRKKKVSRWANVCMYAELLEMNQDPVVDMENGQPSDGLPEDLEDNWIAVAPIPLGKRCLAVSTPANGVGGVVSITALKSRLKGHTLLKFPSSLPANTILDCILDANWQKTGILHVLDVIRWRGMAFDDCSADMRFWWRDVRLQEIGQLRPEIDPAEGFQYPVFFFPVPYTDKPSISTFFTSIIPQCRVQRPLQVLVPTASAGDDEMEIDQAALQRRDVAIDPDGILLYVRETYYESGTSPLCVWVPSKSLSPENNSQSPLDVFESILRRRVG
ncbi:hypothetical protein BKA62DRAFT_240586 [Auriculariales sp. MPI-PUGE-AT-0066]|nr:hypothetical protein BKA62DRAFT_240586 [Auriculariales sp. MPI-PUGE-AT-0066]